MGGLAGIALFGWVAFRPGWITENLGMWGPLAKWLPDLGRVFGVVVEDGEARFTEPAARFWRGFARFVGIFGVVIGLLLVVHGIGEAT